MNDNESCFWYLGRRCLLDIFLFMAMFLALLVSLLMTFYRFHDAHDWFQRSGSIITVLSAIIEYRHFSVFGKDTVHQSVLCGQLSGMPSITFIVKLRNYIGSYSIFGVILGTITWGYGDLFFKPVG